MEYAILLTPHIFEIANFEDSVRHFDGIRRTGILPFLWAFVNSVCKLSAAVR